MNLRLSRHRVLDPLERFSEILFGLIMVLTFTCALGVVEVGREDVRAMIIGAVGCNLAWGLIDAAFYLIGCLTERGREGVLLRDVQQAASPRRATDAVEGALPEPVATVLQQQDFARIAEHLRGLPAPPPRPRLTAANWRGAVGVFLLVFVSTFPVVVPFLLIGNVAVALRVSNAVAIVLLFGAGYMLAGYAGLRRVPTGLAMVGLGAALVGLAIVLGG